MTNKFPALPRSRKGWEKETEEERHIWGETPLCSHSDLHTFALQVGQAPGFNPIRVSLSLKD